MTVLAEIDANGDVLLTRGHGQQKRPLGSSWGLISGFSTVEFFDILWTCEDSTDAYTHPSTNVFAPSLDRARELTAF